MYSFKVKRYWGFGGKSFETIEGPGLYETYEKAHDEAHAMADVLLIFHPLSGYDCIVVEDGIEV